MFGIATKYEILFQFSSLEFRHTVDDDPLWFTEGLKLSNLHPLKLPVVQSD